MRVWFEKPGVSNGKLDRVVVHDFDVWCIGTTVAKIMVPLLKRYRKVCYGVPGCMFGDGSEKDRAEAEAKWEGVLDKIQWSMEQIAYGEVDEPEAKRPEGVTRKEWDERFWAYIDGSKEDAEMRDAFEEAAKKSVDYNARVQEGCELLGKHLRDLWE